MIVSELYSSHIWNVLRLVVSSDNYLTALPVYSSMNKPFFSNRILHLLNSKISHNLFVQPDLATGVGQGFAAKRF